MLRHKVLTAACIVAILGTGACFLPPVHMPQPPPPVRDLGGVRLIRVEVANDASPTHLEAGALRDAFVEELTRQGGLRGIRAKADIAPGTRAATFHLTIHRELVQTYRSGQGDTKPGVMLQLAYDATLRSADGDLLWTRHEEHADFFYLPHPSEALAPWDDRRAVDAGTDRFVSTIARAALSPAGN